MGWREQRERYGKEQVTRVCRVCQNNFLTPRSVASATCSQCKDRHMRPPRKCADQMESFCKRCNATTSHAMYTQDKRCMVCRRRDYVERSRVARNAQFPETKKCKQCHETKAVDEFSTNGGVNYFKSSCKRCTAFNARCRRLNLTPEELQPMLLTSKCQICDCVFDDDKFIRCIDHDHSSGRIRGVLCSRCNLIIGICKDDSTYFMRAAQYIKRQEVVHAKESPLL